MQTIIVDGSNVVRGMYQVEQHLDYNREISLADVLIDYLQSLNTDASRIIEVYFDGCKRYISRPQGVQVFFAAYKKADDLIVNAVYEYRTEYNNDVLLVTSDNALISRSRQYGANVQYTYAFLRNLEQFFHYTA